MRSINRLLTVALSHTLPLTAALGLCALVAAPSTAHARSLRQRPTLRIDHVDASKPPLVRLYVTELDSNGKVRPKRRGGYRLLVNGLPQAKPTREQRFIDRNERVAVTLVVQIATTMSPVFKQIIDGCKRLIDGLPVGSQVGLVAYADVVVKQLKPTSKSKAKKALDKLGVRQALKMQLPDAIRDAIESMQSRKLPPHRMIVVVSDGLTADLKFTVFSRLGRRAKSQKIAIHTIGRAPLEPVRLRTLYELSRRSAGTFRPTSNGPELSAAFSGLRTELRQRRVLTYKLPKLFTGRINDFQIESGDGMASDLVSAEMVKWSAGGKIVTERKWYASPLFIVTVTAVTLMLLTMGAVVIWRMRKKRNEALARKLRSNDQDDGEPDDLGGGDDDYEEDFYSGGAQPAFPGFGAAAPAASPAQPTPTAQPVAAASPMQPAAPMQPATPMQPAAPMQPATPMQPALAAQPTPAPSMPAPNPGAPMMPAPSMPGPSMPGPSMPGPSMPGPSMPGPSMPGPSMPAPAATNPGAPMMPAPAMPAPAPAAAPAPGGGPLLPRPSEFMRMAGAAPTPGAPAAPAAPVAQPTPAIQPGAPLGRPSLGAPAAQPTPAIQPGAPLGAPSLGAPSLGAPSLGGPAVPSVPTAAPAAAAPAPVAQPGMHPGVQPGAPTPGLPGGAPGGVPLLPDPLLDAAAPAPAVPTFSFSGRKTQVLPQDEIMQIDVIGWLVALAGDFPTLPLRDGFRIAADHAADFPVQLQDGQPSEARFHLDATGKWAIVVDTADAMTLRDNERFNVGAMPFVFKVAARFAEKDAQACFQVVGGIDDGRQLPLSEGEAVCVGADQSCGLMIRGDGVGPRHLLAQLDARTCHVADLGCETGLRVNGRPVGSVTLNPNDQIEVGSLRLVFRC